MTDAAHRKGNVFLDCFFRILLYPLSGTVNERGFFQSAAIALLLLDGAGVVMYLLGWGAYWLLWIPHVVLAVSIPVFAILVSSGVRELGMLKED